MFATVINSFLTAKLTESCHSFGCLLLLTQFASVEKFAILWDVEPNATAL